MKLQPFGRFSRQLSSGLFDLCLCNKPKNFTLLTSTGRLSCERVQIERQSSGIRSSPNESFFFFVTHAEQPVDLGPIPQSWHDEYKVKFVRIKSVSCGYQQVIEIRYYLLSHWHDSPVGFFFCFRYRIIAICTVFYILCR